MGEEKDSHHQQIGGSDAQDAAGVEVAEVVGLGAAIEKDAGDEEAGEDEEEVHAHVAEVRDVAQAAEEEVGVEACERLVGGEAVVEEDHEDGDAANDVEAGHVAEARLRGC